LGQDDSSRRTLYLRFTVEPLSDGISEQAERYYAGWVFSEKGVQTLGLGNAFNAWGYSAFNTAEQGMGNDKAGEFDFVSINHETLGRSEFEPPRMGVRRTLAARIEYVPGEPDLITVWMEPDLKAGATEEQMLEAQTTHFRANASFDTILLTHQGGGPGWRIGDLMVATRFKDLTERRFWQRPGFLWWSVVGILSALGGWGWRRATLRERSLIRQRDELESRNALEAERTRIARDLHDSLGATLSEISLLSSIAQCSPQPTRELSKIEQRARESVEALEDIIWASNPQDDTVRSFVDHTSRFATEFLTTAGIRITVSAPPTIQAGQMQAAVRHNAFMAFKEAIHNIVKHARATEVQVTFARQSDHLDVTIADNGLGTCPPENACGPDNFQGHGLRNMRSRMASIGGSATVDGRPEHGTQVRFKIPL